MCKAKFISATDHVRCKAEKGGGGGLVGLLAHGGGSGVSRLYGISGTGREALSGRERSLGFMPEKWQLRLQGRGEVGEGHTPFDGWGGSMQKGRNPVQCCLSKRTLRWEKAWRQEGSMTDI